MKRQSGRKPTRQIDYREVELISSGGELEETITGSESGIESVKLEPGEHGFEQECEPRNSQWTPGTLRSRTETVTEQWNRLARASSELAMARETDKSSIERMMEMMLQMQMQEKLRRSEKGGRKDRKGTEMGGRARV